ncbi:MAG: hypothetical protein KDI06_14505, partial [Calditrichaeota bacterium]|nr:hypothetical protein [Calditrichota bacterium]
MNSSLSLKRLEKNGKKLLKRLLLMVLGRRNAAPLSRERIAKVLVFRLDQRIGNGVLLLPLLSAIRET